MTKELVTVTRDFKVDQCMGLMIEHRIRHLPILENKKVGGIISMGDVLKIMIKESQRVEIRSKNLSLEIIKALPKLVCILMVQIYF